jgi:hypothetical protein
LFTRGAISENTLLVWDIDNTLIQASSDYSVSGAQPICPKFSEIIRKTQAKNIINIALTNASPFDNNFTLEKGNLNLTFNLLIAERNICPSYFHANLDAGEPLTYENLRIAGLKHIGIDFTGPEMQKLPKTFGLVRLNYDTKKHPSGEDLVKIVAKNGRAIGEWVDTADQTRYLYIQMDASPPEAEPNNYQKRHFLQRDNRFIEIVCNPIFSSGIIFCNFFSVYAQCCYGSIKGVILRSFLAKSKNIRTFFNVIFIDDILACVENTVDNLDGLGIPCIGINITPELTKE